MISFTNELWTSKPQLSPDDEPDGDSGNKGRHWRSTTTLLARRTGSSSGTPTSTRSTVEIEIGGFKKDVGTRAAHVPDRGDGAPQRAVLHRARPLHAERGHREGRDDRPRRRRARRRRQVPQRTADPHPHGAGLRGRGRGARRLRALRQGLRVLAGGFRTDPFRPERMELAENEPERLVREAGIPGRTTVQVRWFVRAPAGPRCAGAARRAGTSPGPSSCPRAAAEGQRSRRPREGPQGGPAAWPTTWGAPRPGRGPGSGRRAVRLPGAGGWPTRERAVAPDPAEPWPGGGSARSSARALPGRRRAH